jgi:hypothetical protein
LLDKLWVSFQNQLSTSENGAIKTYAYAIQTLMNESKCKALKTELSLAGEPKLVSIERFFDGNGDAGSIGCNLIDHPGIDVFREILTGLLRRSDVNAVFAQIAELNPGDGCWPFTDKVVVIGSIYPNDLSDAVSVLQPTEIGASRDFKELAKIHGGRSLVLWWD